MSTLKTTTTTTVIIIGGGIAGLTAAICLKQNGFDCKVFERNEDKRTTTSAINLSSSGVCVLKEIGLLAAIEERAQAVRFNRMLNADGELVAEFNCLGREQYGQDAQAMTRRVLHEVLTQNCKKLGIDVHYDCRLVSLTQQSDAVEATFANGLVQPCNFE